MPKPPTFLRRIAAKLRQDGAKLDAAASSETVRLNPSLARKAIVLRAVRDHLSRSGEDPSSMSWADVLSAVNDRRRWRGKKKELRKRFSRQDVEYVVKEYLAAQADDPELWFRHRSRDEFIEPEVVAARLTSPDLKLSAAERKRLIGRTDRLALLDSLARRQAGEICRCYNWRGWLQSHILHLFGYWAETLGVPELRTSRRTLSRAIKAAGYHRPEQLARPERISGPRVCQSCPHKEKYEGVNTKYQVWYPKRK